MEPTKTETGATEADETPARVVDPNAVHCHFWDQSAGGGRNIHSKCEGEAKGFVRVKHTGRLCPLCAPCKDTFVRAQSEMNPEVKKTIPGLGEYEEVSLSDGTDEFKKQPAKKEK
jgi:hypothetical protein